MKHLIVVVEDDAGMRRALSRLLQASGHGARLFESAEALLAADGAQDARCLVLDVRLPGMSGPDLYARLRAASDVCPPAIFITSHDSEAVRKQISDCGGGQLLTKPFPGGELLGALARLAPP